MAHITGREHFEQWLGGKPRTLAVALAVRSALRTAPLLARSLNGANASDRADFLLPVLRAASCASAFCGGAAEAAISIAPPVTVRASGSASALAAAKSCVSALMSARTTSCAQHAAAAADSAAFAAASASAGNTPSSGAASAAVTWEALNVDAVRAPSDAALLLARPLWPQEIGEPEWSLQHWTMLRRELNGVATEEGWVVWLDWLEARRDGVAFNLDAERKIAALPTEVWRSGPQRVNAAIAKIQAGAASTSERAAEVKRLLHALNSDPLQATMSDFVFDDFAEMMRMVPFLDDVGRIGDDRLERERTDLLGTLGDIARNLANDLYRLRSNAGDIQMLTSALERYADESIRPIKDVRARFLWAEGESMNDARLIEEVYSFLPRLAQRKLDRFVDAHLDLMRIYFQGALGRLEKLDSVTVGEGVTLHALNDMIAEAADAIDASRSADGAHIDPNAAATLRSLSRQIAEQAERLETLPQDARAREERTLWARTKAGVLTILRSNLKLKAEDKRFAELSNAEYKRIVARISEMLKGVDGG